MASTPMAIRAIPSTRSQPQLRRRPWTSSATSDRKNGKLADIGCTSPDVEGRRMGFTRLVDVRPAPDSDGRGPINLGGYPPTRFTGGGFHSPSSASFFGQYTRITT